MIRTSLLTAAATAALATASLLATDAAARGFAGHLSRPALQTVSRAASRTAQHFGNQRVARHNEGSRTSGLRTSAHQNFGQRRQNQSTTSAAQQNTTNHTIQSHPNVSLNSSRPIVNTSQSRVPATLASNHAHEGSAQPRVLQNRIAQNNNQKAGPNTRQGNARSLTPSQVTQMQNAAAAAQQTGNADIAAAAQLNRNAALLTMHANEVGPQSGTGKLLLAQAATLSQQATSLNSRGQDLLQSAKAETAVLAAGLNFNGFGTKSTTTAGTTPAGTTPAGPTTAGNTNSGNNNGGGNNTANGNRGTGSSGHFVGSNTNSGWTNAGTWTSPGATPIYPSSPVQVASAAPVNAAPIAQPPQAITTFKALSLAWNQNGGWVVRMADTLPAASQDALTACNGQFGGCQQAATVDNAAFGCLAIMSNSQQELFSATGPTLEEVTASLQQQLQSRGEQGELAYSGCNSI